MSKCFYKSNRTALGTAVKDGRRTAFPWVLFLLNASTRTIFLQISKLLYALVLVGYFHHCLQSKCHVWRLRLCCRPMVVNKAEIVEFPVWQAGIKALQGVPWSVAHTNRNDAEWNNWSLNDSLNCFRLLGYLAISYYNKDVVFACMMDNVNCFSDDRCQTGRTTQCYSSHHFIVHL